VNRNGAFAEYIVLPMTNIWLHSARSIMDVAAIFDPLGNAVHTALAFPVLGEDVLVTGAGPIGIMAAAVARHAGARHVVISDPNPYRRELAEKVGVTLAVDPRETTLKDVQAELGMQEGFDVGWRCRGIRSVSRHAGEHEPRREDLRCWGFRRRDGDRLEYGDLQPADAARHLWARDV
jgi:threonine 3-dehydrogenase